MDLVVGIGNELRTDDGVGARIVRDLPRRAGVETAVVHQLTPDLVETLGRAERVLFVDAHRTEATLRLRPLRRSASSGGLGHAIAPESIIAWTEAACGRAPAGWLLSVPACSFAVGDALSPDVERALPDAERAVLDWLDRREPSASEEDA